MSVSAYKPEFKGPIEGWVVNFLTDNYWRVQATMTRLDCLQEAHLIFLRCSRRYKAENAKHFMSLFQRCWINHFTDLTVDDTKVKQCGPLPEDLEEPTGLQLVGELDNDGYLRHMIAQAPSEVSLVLTLFLNAPSELLDMAMKSWRSKGKLRAGGNAHVARLLGLPADSRPLDAVQQYFDE